MTTIGDDKDREATSEDADALVEIVDEPPRPPPTPVMARRSTRRSLPPMPGNAIAMHATGSPETPSVVDRALARDQIEPAVTAAAMQRSVDEAAREPARAAEAAALAYELGELYERVGDLVRAIASYQRALQLDSGFQLAGWALRRVFARRGRWSEIAALLDAEIDATDNLAARADLLLERATVPDERVSEDESTRMALEIALRLAPHNVAVLLELERATARRGETITLVGVLEHLAEALEHPEFKVAYWLEAARLAAPLDYPRACRALDAASPIKKTRSRAFRIARARARLAEEHGKPDDVVAAIAALVDVLSTTDPDEPQHIAIANRRKVVALYRRQAQLSAAANPTEAWRRLHQALALSPDEAVVLVDLIELARKIGRTDELPTLVQAWYAGEGDPGRASMISWWCAEAAQAGVDEGPGLRTLLRELSRRVPSFVMLTAAAECDAILDPDRVAELGDIYLIAARAAKQGTWVGPGLMVQPDLPAAAALYLQAAEVFAFHVGTEVALARARDVLQEVTDTIPDHPAVIEAVIELDDSTGDGSVALARLCKEAGTDRRGIERAIGVAYRHGRFDAVLELERSLVEHDPADYLLAWRLESTLWQLGRNVERAQLLVRLAHEDPEPARRRTALLGAAQFHAAHGSLDVATDLYQDLLVLWPDPTLHATLIDLLRAGGRWEDLIRERLAEVRSTTNPGAMRRALREAAWIVEVRLDDPARAADIYGEWLMRLQGDRTALEGDARCSVRLKDYAREVAARGAIVAQDPTIEARWSYARSLERAGNIPHAAELYYELAATATPATVAGAGAAVALGDIAALSGDIRKRADAADALAQQTTDPQLGASLREECGWIELVAIGNREGAATAFVAALAHDDTRLGALLGVALVAACELDPRRSCGAFSSLAAASTDLRIKTALYLRAAAYAAADGNARLADAHVEAARLAAPTQPEVLFASSESDPPEVEPTTDPFAAVDQLVRRAEVLDARARLVDDPLARVFWELERAEVLERAGQLQEATDVIAGVLARVPTERRALVALRRLAERAGDNVIWANASYALARMTRDPENRLRLLRAVAGVYDHPGPSRDPSYVIAMLERIVQIDRQAPEVERLLELLREHDDAYGLTLLLTDLVQALGDRDESRVVGFLVERALSLDKLGRHAEACADLDAVIDRCPDRVDALNLRAVLAVAGGEPERAIALWRQCQRFEQDPLRSAELDRLIDETLERNPIARPATREASSSQELDETTNTWAEIELDHSDPEPPVPPLLSGDSVTAPVQPIPKRRISRNIKRVTPPPDPGDPFAAQTVLGDPFGANTPRVDVSGLQEQELRLARTTPLAFKAVKPLGEQTTDVMELPMTITETASVATDVAPAPSQLQIPALDLTKISGRRTTVSAEPTLDPAGLRFSDLDSALADSAVVVSYDQLKPGSIEHPDELLLELEREIELEDVPARLVEYRIHAGRMAERLGQGDDAREHYDAARLIDPRAQAPLQGLRRIARGTGDLAEAARIIDAELAVVNSRERELLERYRIDLLLAAGEQDLARVAVGELLDRTPTDVPTVLAQLGLTLVDHRSDDLAVTLESLITGITVQEDLPLRSALEFARGVLAAHAGDHAAAARWFNTAAESDAGSPAFRLEALRASASSDGSGARLLDLACEVEKDDPATAAALAIRASTWGSADDHETIMAGAQLAARAAGRDLIVARFTAETSLAERDTALAGHAFSRWARSKCNPIERGYAAARAAELDSVKFGRLWAQVLELDPDDDYALAQLRAAHVGAGDLGQAIALDRQVAATGGTSAALRAAYALTPDDLDGAIELLGSMRDHDSPAIAEALVDAYTTAGRWPELAKLLGELAANPGMFAGDVIRLRRAYAMDKVASGSSPEELEGSITAALDAWDSVHDDDPHAPIAHAAAMLLAKRLGDPGVLVDVLARSRAVERSPWAAASLGLRHARVLLHTDPKAAQDIAREATGSVDDPRTTVTTMIAAARRQDLRSASGALDERSERISGSTPELVMLSLRAGLLALKANDRSGALAAFERVDSMLPTFADDLIAIAAPDSHRTNQRARDKAPSFVRVVLDADRATAAGDYIAALALYRKALDVRFGDPLAADPILRIALQLKDPKLIKSIANVHIRVADTQLDTVEKADALELLARVEAEMGGDAATERKLLANAFETDPERIDLVLRLERELVAERRGREMLALRTLRIERVGASPRDRVAILMDTAGLEMRERRPVHETAELYRQALAIEPANRLAMMRLEGILRSRPDEELARLEEQIASHVSDPRATAAALSRAGEVFAKLGRPEDAVARFARATDVVPTYVAALDAWYEIALGASLWTSLAEVTTRKAAIAGDSESAATLHHFAGVVLMDQAHAIRAAIVALERALAANPRHLDTFLRLRILYETVRKDHADMLRTRLELEREPNAQIELHRMLGEHCRNDRDVALRHYRAMLAIDPGDARAHAAIADLNVDPRNWQEAAEAVLARIPLERDVVVLRSLHYRLGEIFAGHDPGKAARAFHRSLSYNPDDDEARSRLADLAIAAEEWQLALEACDKLVSTERDPERLAAHLRRAATLFARGFNDRARSERMLLLALERAPTDLAALQMLLELYAGDTASLVAHTTRIAELMRVRVAEAPLDGAAYCMLARAVAARAAAMADGSMPMARAAAEVADILGAGGEPERQLIADASTPTTSMLARVSEDELFIGAAQPQLRRLLRALADPLARHFGSGVSKYGVGRKDRLRPPHPVASVACDLANAVGFREVDVYVSTRHPYAMVAEPESPLVLVLGSAVVANPAMLRFAVGGAVKLAQLSLAIPSQLPVKELAVMVLATLRLYEPGLAVRGIDEAATTTHATKLRKLVPASLVETTRSIAVKIDVDSPQLLARDLKIAGLRAGLCASGRLQPAFALLAGSVGIDVSGSVADPISQALISFALSHRRS